MTKIIQLSTVREQRQLSVEEAWKRFAEAKRLAEKTLRFEDGIAANRALREFFAACEKAGL